MTLLAGDASNKVDAVRAVRKILLHYSQLSKVPPVCLHKVWVVKMMFAVDLKPTDSVGHINYQVPPKASGSEGDL